MSKAYADYLSGRDQSLLPALPLQIFNIMLQHFIISFVIIYIMTHLIISP